jgi:hypothetical protein
MSAENGALVKQKMLQCDSTRSGQVLWVRGLRAFEFATRSEF